MVLQFTRVNTPTWLYPYKCPYAMKATTITVHETGNFATAMAEVSYMLNNTNEVSYHVAVDDERAVQGLPFDRNGWHSGDGQGNGNRKSIAFEICYNYRNGKLTNNDPVYNAKYLKARANAIEAIAQVCLSQGIVPKQGVTLFRHYDRNGKNCPQRIIADGYWIAFCNAVVKRYNELKKGGTTVAKEDKRTAHHVLVGWYNKNSASLKKLQAYLKKENMNNKIIVDPKNKNHVWVSVGSFSQSSGWKRGLENYLDDNRWSYAICFKGQEDAIIKNWK